MPTQNQRIYWEYKSHPNKNYKEIHFRMSNKKMADILFATIQTHAHIANTFTLGYEYDRKQQSYHNCHAIIEIAPQLEAEFEQISGCRLEERAIYQLNVVKNEVY